jgi:acetyl-CoA acetyltransferase
MTVTTGRRACVVGIGETEYTKRGGTDKSEYRLALEAILAAVGDAGLSVDDVDGFSTIADERSLPAAVAGDLGVPQVRFLNTTAVPGGGAPCASLGDAAMAVEAGMADVVVVYRSLCQGQFTRIGRMLAANAKPAPPVPTVAEAATETEAVQGFTVPFGVFGPSIMFALPIRRHMERYGTTGEHLGHVAVTFREHANRNPRAVMRDQLLTLEDHQASRMVADPYRLFDCCLETDGACALVVTTAERAADTAKGGVAVLATAQGTTAGHMLGSALVNAGEWADDYTTGAGTSVARELWGRAGVGPGDVDVAQLYDNFTGQVLFGLEDYGFCGPGESGPMVAGGALRWDGGSLPTNTSGGNLSEVYMQGFNHLLEAVRQLRGESTCQVANAEVAFVNSSPGIPTSAAVFGKLR